MARPTPDQLSPSGRHLATEYARAREQGISQKQFAESVGMTPRYVRKILSGERSGRVLEQRAAKTSVWSVPVTYQGETGATVQVRLPEGTSRWDIYRPSVRERMKRAVSRAEREEKLRTKPANELNETDKIRKKGKKRWDQIRPARNLGYRIIPVTSDVGYMRGAA